jgi:hypothetical protein
MRHHAWLQSIVGLVLVGTGVARAGELNLSVILSGQVAPGVYGEVQLGGSPPPPVVYAQPMLIEPATYAVAPPPVYLHVPPDHALHWREHCREYNACHRPVYFVRSAEYEPGYGRHDREHHRDHEHDHDRDRDRSDEHDRDHWHHDDRDHDRDHGHEHD